MRLNNLFLVCKSSLHALQLHNIIIQLMISYFYTMNTAFPMKQLFTDKLIVYSLSVLLKSIISLKLFLYGFICTKAYVNNIHKL